MHLSIMIYIVTTSLTGVEGTKSTTLGKLTQVYKKSENGSFTMLYHAPTPKLTVVLLPWTLSVNKKKKKKSELPNRKKQGRSA